jgi:quercetin dioxygenase-like cupin family protein
MTTVNVNQLELNEFIGALDPKQHCKATFPLVGAHGSKELATVYFEIEPGDNLGMHTDSAEELLVILEGKAEATVGGEKKEATKGGLVLIPEMEPHNIRNVGASTLKVLGVFGGANNIVATFEQAMLPSEANVVDTALLFK